MAFKRLLVKKVAYIMGHIRSQKVYKQILQLAEVIQESYFYKLDNLNFMLTSILELLFGQYQMVY